MTTYLRRPLIVQAFQYNGEAQVSQLPQWLQDHRTTPNGMGSDAPFISVTRDLLIPTRAESVKVVNGFWVVLENGGLARYSDEEFRTLFVSDEPEAKPTTETTAPEAE